MLRRRKKGRRRKGRRARGVAFAGPDAAKSGADSGEGWTCAKARGHQGIQHSTPILPGEPGPRGAAPRRQRACHAAEAHHIWCAKPPQAGHARQHNRSPPQPLFSSSPFTRTGGLRSPSSTASTSPIAAGSAPRPEAIHSSLHRTPVRPWLRRVRGARRDPQGRARQASSTAAHCVYDHKRIKQATKNVTGVERRYGGGWGRSGSWGQDGLLLFQLAQAAGDLGEVAGLEQAEGEAGAAVAPAAHEQEAAEEEGQAAPGRSDQTVLEALVRFPVAGGAGGGVAMAEQALGFPGGVLVVLAHVGVDAAQVAVVDAGADQTHRPAHERVFVHLHVALRPVIFLDALVFHLAHAEEGELAQGVAAPQAATQEIVGVAEQETLLAAARQGGGDLALHRRGEDLIGIEKQHPFGAGGVVPEEPVALFGEVAVPVEIDQLSAMAAGN